MKHLLAYPRRFLRSAAQRMRGFTLIETFVAVTILVMAIAGPLTIAARGLDTAFIASDQITASYLAQDAVEYVRWVRDTNSLQGRSWLANLSNCTSSDSSYTCRFDSTEDPTVFPPAACSTSGAACTTHLRYNGDPNNSCPGSPDGTHLYFFNYYCGSGNKADQRFTRTVSIVCQGSCSTATEAAINATVTWDDQGVVRSVADVEDIFNWH